MLDFQAAEIGGTLTAFAFVGGLALSTCGYIVGAIGGHIATDSRVAYGRRLAGLVGLLAGACVAYCGAWLAAVAIY